MRDLKLDSAFALTGLVTRRHGLLSTAPAAMLGPAAMPGPPPFQ